jgi:hypothetical protein
MTIIYPKNQYFPQYSLSTLHFHVYNTSGHLQTTGTTCSLHIYNTTGNHILENESLLVDSNSKEFYYKISGKFTETIGEYSYLIACNNTKEGGFVSTAYYISPNNILIQGVSGVPLAIIIILPMLLGFIFLLGSFFLGEEHNAIKIFLFIISIVPFFMSMNYGMITLINYYNFTELQDLIGTHVYWVTLLFFTILTYFIIYWLYKIIQFTAEKKKKGLEY